MSIVVGKGNTVELCENFKSSARSAKLLERSYRLVKRNPAVIRRRKSRKSIGDIVLSRNLQLYDAYFLALFLSVKMSEGIHHFNIFGIKIIGLIKSEGYHVLAADVGNRLESISVVAVINNRLVRHFCKPVE